MAASQSKLQNGVASPKRGPYSDEDKTTTTASRNLGPDFDTLLHRSPNRFVHDLRTQSVELFANGGATSSASPSSNNPSIFSGHVTTSTFPSQYETEYSLPIPKPAGLATSSINATDGSDVTSSTDELEYFWGRGDDSNQFNRDNDKKSRRQKFRKRRDVVIHQDKDREAPNPEPASLATESLSNLRKVMILFLVLLGLATIIFTLYRCYLFDATVVDNVRRTKRTLCYSTHVLALCAGVGMLVGRRTGGEALGTFIAVLLVGGSIKTEFLE